jgi:hypothetical protein
MNFTALLKHRDDAWKLDEKLLGFILWASIPKDELNVFRVLSRLIHDQL